MTVLAEALSSYVTNGLQVLDDIWYGIKWKVLVLSG
jgi:hypothetical protein